MEINETYYIDLITSYFSGEASEDDIRFLEAWVSADAAHTKIFEEHSRTWSLLQREKIETRTDVDAEWKKIQGKVATSHSPSIIPLPFRGGWVGAFRIAALILLLLIPTFFIYRHFAAAPMVQVTAENSVREIILPDGSGITLNAGSTLAYPEKFKGSTREVKLSGEGYFKVTRNEDMPFIVSCGEVRVKVLGTQFNVNTKALRGTMEVVLTSGKVSVYFKEQTPGQVILDPGEKAEIPADFSGISKSVNEDPNYMSWKTLHFVFVNTPLSQALATLSAAYHRPIRLKQNNPGSCRITATFDKQSLESVLNVLKATLDLQISNTGSGFEISGNGCN